MKTQPSGVSVRYNQWAGVSPPISDSVLYNKEVETEQEHIQASMI